MLQVLTSSVRPVQSDPLFDGGRLLQSCARLCSLITTNRASAPRYPFAESAINHMNKKE